MTFFDPGEISLYFRHIWSVLALGSDVRLPSTYGDVTPGELKDWTEDDVILMIEEGRRQLDSLATQFEQTRSRGQYLFTLGLAVLVSTAAGATRLTHNVLLFLLWFAGFILLVISLLGAATIVVASGRLGGIDSVLLSRTPRESGLARELAAAYPGAVVISADTVRVRHSMLRDSVWFMVVGLILVGVGVLIVSLSS
jgi:hypothetical protein